MRKIRVNALPTILLAILVAVGGCSVSSGESDRVAEPFSGPWGLQYRDIYEKTNSKEIRSIVADERITDAEYERARQIFSDCLDKEGLEFRPENESLGFAIVAPPGKADTMQDYIDSCKASTGFADIDFLYQMTGARAQRNTVEAMIECFKRHNLADAAMTAEEYRRIAGDPSLDEEIFGEFFDESKPNYDANKSKDYWACQANPNW